MEQIYEYIRAIYETGSFRAAAEALHVTQPALSIALKKYEDQLGAQIFDRRRHPYELTPAGEIVVRGLERLSDEERRMQAQLLDLQGGSGGEIFIGATHYVNTCVLPPIIAACRARYPNVRLRIAERSSNEIAQHLMDDLYDLAVCASGFQSDAVLRLPVLRDELCWVIPNHLLPPQLPVEPAKSKDAFPRLRSLSVFGQVPFIALMPGDSLYRRALDLFSASQITPQICLNVPQSTTAWYMACAGVGAALVPARMPRITAPSGADVTVFSYDSPLMERTISLFCRTDRYISTATRHFIDLCRSSTKKGR